VNELLAGVILASDVPVPFVAARAVETDVPTLLSVAWSAWISASVGPVPPFHTNGTHTNGGETV
jgi:hypothetical protein